MKQVLIYSLLLLTLSGQAQFKINYNPDTNTMTVEYNICDDPCVWDSVADMEACNCNTNCNSSFENCRNECIKNFSGIVNLTACIDICIQNQRLCKNKCDPEKEPDRRPCGISYVLIADHAPIPNDPRLHQGNRIFSENFSVSCVTDNIEDITHPIDISIENWEIPFPWPGIYSERNTCYGIDIIILYDDESACRGVFWECNIIG